MHAPLPPARGLATPASGRPPRLAPAGFRVVALRLDHSQGLVALAATLRQATNRAAEFRNSVIARRTKLTAEGAWPEDEIVAVHVEEWVGTLFEGCWEPARPQREGFTYFSAACTKRTPGRRKRNNFPVPRTQTDSLPASGQQVECVLLPETTRKGGWKAKLLQSGTEGPITNTADVPKSAKRGQTVTLRVGAIARDGKRIQFHWRQADNPKCR